MFLLSRRRYYKMYNETILREIYKNIILIECKVKNKNKTSKIGIEEDGRINIIIYIE